MANDELTSRSSAELIELAAVLADGWVSLSFGATPIARETFIWSTNPSPGDLVLVRFTARDAPLANRIGVYDAAWTYLGEPDDEALGWRQPFRDRASETVYGIRTLDGRYVKWANVELRRLPETVEDLNGPLWRAQVGATLAVARAARQ